MAAKAVLPMEYALIGGFVLHVISRQLLLFKLLWEKTCRGVSLITQELYLTIYIFRYLDLLYLYVSFSNTVIKVFHLCVALAVVLLIRYSPAVGQTYDADLDTFPRAVLIAPCFVLAFFYNKVKLLIEICHSFSVYLEAVALIPQFVLMYKRKAYEGWVLAFVILCGGERLLQSISVLSDWAEATKDDPYSVAADIVHSVVYIVGLAVLLFQKAELKKQQGANETEKPAFDEVWEASKFQFEDQEAGKANAGSSK